MEYVNILTTERNDVGIFRRSFDGLKRLTNRIVYPPSPPQVTREQRVFLVRTGEPTGSAAPVPDWPLSEVGKEQAQQAGLAIAGRLAGAKAIVFFWPDAALRYRQTARIIAGVLGVPTVNCYLSHSPGVDDLSVLEQFEGPVVIVTNGTHLMVELRRHLGPEVALDVLSPPHGSVHELVVTYRHTEFGGRYEEISRRFV